MRVLVVEDVGFVRHNVERLLTNNGHDVVISISGEKALEMFRTDHKIDVVISGLFMSGISAIELFKKSKSIQCFDDFGKRASPAFILTITAEQSFGDSNKSVLVQQALDLGFVGVLPKPINSDQLIALLRDIEINRKIGARENRLQNIQQDVGGTHFDSSINQVHNELQIQMLQEIRGTLSQLQIEISTQINRLDNTLETIGT